MGWSIGLCPKVGRVAAPNQTEGRRHQMFHCNLQYFLSLQKSLSTFISCWKSRMQSSVSSVWRADHHEDVEATPGEGVRPDSMVKRRTAKVKHGREPGSRPSVTILTQETTDKIHDRWCLRAGYLPWACPCRNTSGLMRRRLRKIVDETWVHCGNHPESTVQRKLNVVRSGYNRGLISGNSYGRKQRRRSPNQGGFGSSAKNNRTRPL